MEDNSKLLRVFGISDIHIDQKPNLSWCEAISEEEYVNDAILISGDVSHKMEDLELIFKIFLKKFKYVFYIPGNHCLWLPSQEKEEFQTSIKKLQAIVALCGRLGVKMKPQLVDNKIWIVPMYSWYEESFDNESDTNDYPISGWGDHVFCKWGNIDPLEFFVAENEQWMRIKEFGDDATPSQFTKSIFRDHHPIVSFSHFLPRRECLPRREFLFHKFLPKVVGSNKLESQIRRLGTDMHFFGHTHINWDKTIDGIRYIQKSLGYPSERNSWKKNFVSMNELILWDSSKGWCQPFGGRN